MPIPDYQTIMLPLLKFAADGKEHSSRESIDFLATEFRLSLEECNELLPSGKQPIFNNRVGWAATYLRKAELVESKKRGYFSITDRGETVLSENPERIDVKFLEQFPEFLKFREKDPIKPPPPPIINPEELLEAAYQELKETVASELLQNIGQCSPAFFERLVVDLLTKIGYGGSRKEAGQAIGQTGDGGIDGIIKEDKLGLDIIYIQAKRWRATVGRPEIQKFAGAFQGQRARKGIFITTSSFSKEASDYVKHIDTKIILVDGERLAELMIDHNVGVSPVADYEVKRIDGDYFIEE